MLRSCTAPGPPRNVSRYPAVPSSQRSRPKRDRSVLPALNTEVDAAPLQLGEQRVADVADGPEVDQHRPGDLPRVEAGAELVEQRPCDARG